MKYEMMQLINQIKDNINELDESGLTNPLLDDIYHITTKMEELLEENEDDNERYDWEID